MSNIHNPENVASPGEGYRFLTKEEVRNRAKRKADRTQLIERSCKKGRRVSWMKGCRGNAPGITYRTKLTPEELEAEG